MTEDKKNQIDANLRAAKLTIVVTILAVMGFAWLAGGIILLGVAGMFLAVAICAFACSQFADCIEAERKRGMFGTDDIDARVKEVVDQGFLIGADVPRRAEIASLDGRVSRLEAAAKGDSQ